MNNLKEGLSIVELEDRHELAAGCCAGRCSGNDTDLDLDPK